MKKKRSEKRVYELESLIVDGVTGVGARWVVSFDMLLK